MGEGDAVLCAKGGRWRTGRGRCKGKGKEVQEGEGHAEKIQVKRF